MGGAKFNLMTGGVLKCEVSFVQIIECSQAMGLLLLILGVGVNWASSNDSHLSLGILG